MQQRSALIDEYSRFLIGLLSTAIFENSDYRVELAPFDGDESKKKVEVGLKIIDPVSENETRIDFVLHSLDGPWKIYDLNLFGTSTLGANKSFFRDIIKKHGFDGLIADLKRRNEEQAN